MGYCSNYKQVRKLIKRNLIRRMLIILGFILFCQVISGVFHAYSLYDSWQMKKDVEISRPMLDARARMQIKLIETGIRHNAFTDEEKCLLGQNWGAAEYEYIRNNPFAELCEK